MHFVASTVLTSLKIFILGQSNTFEEVFEFGAPPGNSIDRVDVAGGDGSIWDAARDFMIGVNKFAQGIFG